MAARQFLKLFINYAHNGESLKAEVVFNFKEVKDAVLIKDVPPSISKDENILFFRNENGWTSDSEMQYIFPSTYESILDAINKHFGIIEFQDEELA